MATIDILDYLRTGHEEFDNLSDKLYWKTATQKIAITPRWWDEYSGKLKGINFNWVPVKYSELDNHLTSDKKNGNGIGVYLFVVRPEFQIISLPGCVFYVGIAGEKGSGRHLRTRLRNYIQESGIKKRTKVLTALELYHKHTVIYYSKLKVKTDELSQIESDLHGYFMPWANERDYPTKIKLARKAW